MTGPVATAPRIVVTVGTDHHPFDRLISWVNDWLGQHPDAVGSCYVQSGRAAVVPLCARSEFLEISELDRLVDAADVIVCHGGPASISDAWRRGQIPIVVPRLPRLGEHVDDHQVDFCRIVADLGRIRLAPEPAVFARLLDEATADLAGFRASSPQADVDAAVARFGELVDELMSGPRRRLPLILRTRRTRRRPIARADDRAGAGVLPPELDLAAAEHGPAGSGARSPVSSSNAGNDSFAQKEQG
jgi:UDP-N-acetylglucosamine transferase subunit ALG13